MRHRRVCRDAETRLTAKPVRSVVGVMHCSAALYLVGTARDFYPYTVYWVGASPVKNKGGSFVKGAGQNFSFPFLLGNVHARER